MDYGKLLKSIVVGLSLMLFVLAALPACTRFASFVDNRQAPAQEQTMRGVINTLTHQEFVLTTTNQGEEHILLDTTTRYELPTGQGSFADVRVGAPVTVKSVHVGNTWHAVIVQIDTSSTPQHW